MQHSHRKRKYLVYHVIPIPAAAGEESLSTKSSIPDPISHPDVIRDSK
jgi:hypothetical protein